MGFGKRRIFGKVFSKRFLIRSFKKPCKKIKIRKGLLIKMISYLKPPITLWAE
jgi:hypothetical protein